jgi:hypothetical protein
MIGQLTIDSRSTAVNICSVIPTQSLDTSLAATAADPTSVDVKPGVIGVFPMNRANVGFRVGTYGRLKLFNVFAPCALGCWVIGANMQRKLFVALQLEVAHHFIERCADRRSSRFEAPATFRATKTSKPFLLNPCQLPAHGLPSLCAPQRDCLPVQHPLGVRGGSILLATAYGLIAAENRHSVWGGGKSVKGRAKLICANLDRL